MNFFDNEIKKLSQPIVVSDIVRVTGMSFSEAEKYIYTLIGEYRGEISSDETGKLIFKFPFGFSKPWERVQNIRIILDKIKKNILVISRFLVRSWISIVMIFYAIVFLAISILLLAKQKSDRDRDDRVLSFDFLNVLFRIFFESVYWVLHPFSPFRVSVSLNRFKQRIPLYERINCFVFGPEEKHFNPLDRTKALLNEIFKKKGKIFLLDVIRVTGLVGKEADALIIKFLIDYNGKIFVLNNGRLMYFFPDFQEIKLSHHTNQYEFNWSNRLQPSLLTGNSFKSNFLIIIINLFNLVISFIFIQNNLTLNKLLSYFYNLPADNTSLPVFFGWIPFCFSLTILIFPIIRWCFSFSKKKAIAFHNIKVRFLLTLLNKISKNEIKKSILEKEWLDEFGRKPSQFEFFSIINEFGGEVVLEKNSNEDVCKFPKL